MLASTMKDIFITLRCYFFGHKWVPVKVVAESGRYLYVANYIKVQLSDSVIAHQCKRCKQYILKNESPELN